MGSGRRAARAGRKTRLSLGVNDTADLLVFVTNSLRLVLGRDKPAIFIGVPYSKALARAVHSM